MKSLTLKQRIFVSAYLNNFGNATQAARLAYKCDSNTAGVIGYQNLRKLNIRLAIDEILDKAGLSDEAQVQKLKNSFLASNNVKAIELVFKLRGIDV